MANDERCTPQWFYDRLDAIFHFQLDAAATAENSKCSMYHVNALQEPWFSRPSRYARSATLFGMGDVRSVWCNPPYSNGNVIKFMQKAWLEVSMVPDGLIAMLVQNDTSTKWGQFALHHASYAYYPEKRLKFDSEASAKFASVVYIFGSLDRIVPRYSGPAWQDGYTMNLENLLYKRNRIRNDISMLAHDVSPTVENKREALRAQLREVQKEIDDYPNQ